MTLEADSSILISIKGPFSRKQMVSKGGASLNANQQSCYQSRATAVTVVPFFVRPVLAPAFPRCRVLDLLPLLSRFHLTLPGMERPALPALRQKPSFSTYLACHRRRRQRWRAAAAPDMDGDGISRADSASEGGSSVDVWGGVPLEMA